MQTRHIQVPDSRLATRRARVSHLPWRREPFNFCTADRHCRDRSGSGVPVCPPGASSEGRRAHERWLREQRFAAYTVFVATADKWATRADGPDADGVWRHDQEFYDEMTAVESALALLGPAEVVEAMHPIRSALLHLQDAPDLEAPSAAQQYWKRQQAFVRAAQQQLHPPRRFWRVRQGN